ncbi:hypothetical protein HZH68_001556 [Vespula germanica]|uniref:Uncharacterized protein n=1 Tax=Vespula germanica TaxID=30212 RepID=A0A834NVR6_VESGE|nr:hypothetical protein HZH68_001556 [Vespula germanica]
MRVKLSQLSVEKRDKRSTLAEVGEARGRGRGGRGRGGRGRGGGGRRRGGGGGGGGGEGDGVRGYDCRGREVAKRYENSLEWSAGTRGLLKADERVYFSVTENPKWRSDRRTQAEWSYTGIALNSSACF